jgi:tetratricopeptide (TPR) repeat protein
VMIFKALGYLLLAQGKFGECLVLKQRELESVQDIGDRRMMGIARAEIGEVLCHLGRYTEAQDQIRQGIALLQGRSDYEVAFRHRYLGDVLLADGLLSEAQAAYELSYQFFHSRNEKGWMFTALTGLSRAQLALGDRQGAWFHAVRALRIYADVQLYTFFAYLTVAEIALLLVERGEVKWAFELYNLVLRQGNLAQSRWFADLFGRFIEQTAAHLPADEYSEAKKRGEGLNFSDTIAGLIVYINDRQPES